MLNTMENRGTLPVVSLKPGEEKDLRMGRLWVFDNEIAGIKGEVSQGGLVDIFSARDVFVGRGFCNMRSKIRVRLLTRKREEIDRAFFLRRLSRAVDLRRRLGHFGACRLVFGEADGLPGLTVDKFDDVLVMQIAALGMALFQDTIVDCLVELLHPRAIYERDDLPTREKEGLPQQKGVLYGEAPGLVEIAENGLRMLVDVENGQKTGYFLDQRENRAALAPFSHGRVLDCFCHTGGFALHAAQYGADSVEAVDISASALEMVRKNAALNGLTNITATEANVFDLLKTYQQEKRQYDLVILDPPAFAKSKSALKSAARGYKEINLRGMTLVRPGGFLVTCSCSHFMTPPLFLDMIKRAAADVGKTARILEIRYQAKDHPIGMGADESLYLKCVILQLD
ncbi:MAG: class I SAM-dependent rRNA methyltransferase [Ethanoligenens sp.]